MAMELYEKMDILRQKTGVTYREARRALEATKGDVAAALIWLEEHRPQERKKPVLKRLQSVLQWSAETKIRISKEGKVLAELPAAAGIAALGLTLTSARAAFIGALGISALLNRGYRLEMELNHER
ncbi:MAG: DUF4342 domain-containing protein [Bacillota bacterium]